MKWPTQETQKMIFGFYLLTVVAVLIGIIALGTVREETSAGLKELEGGLLVMIGGFSQWCFTTIGNKGFSSEDKPKDLGA